MPTDHAASTTTYRSRSTDANSRFGKLLGDRSAAAVSRVRQDAKGRTAEKAADERVGEKAAAAELAGQLTALPLACLPTESAAPRVAVATITPARSHVRAPAGAHLSPVGNTACVTELTIADRVTVRLDGLHRHADLAFGPHVDAAAASALSDKLRSAGWSSTPMRAAERQGPDWNRVTAHDSTGHDSTGHGGSGRP